MSKHYQIAIVGGGTAGITVAAQLLRKGINASKIAVIEPSDKHYYQPLWTLVGGGAADAATTERSEASVMPKGVAWVRDFVESFDPENNRLSLRSGEKVGYDYLVVAPGIQLDWGKIPGLKESLGQNGIVSNYAFDQAPKTWEAVRNLKEGNAIFTAPNTPVKCGGAPQKIMYLADAAFRRNGVRDNINVIAGFAGTTIFGVPEFAKTLNKIIADRNIDLRLYHNLIELKPERKEAVFEVFAGGVDALKASGQPYEAIEGSQSLRVTIPYGMIHVTPPQSAPDFIKHSPLANSAGWVDVDKATLQHVKYSNIFSLGDASSLPTSKTGAAVRKQAPAVVSGLLNVMKGQAANGHYDGYTSCPLVTGYGKLVLAEFDYNNKPKPTFPIIDQTKEHYSMYILKKYGLPFMYWNLMLKGLA